MTADQPLLTANEAASITGVPLRQVHRIIDAGLLEGAVERRRNTRLLTRGALVGLRLAYDNADILTLESRRTVLALLIGHPQQSVVRTRGVSVGTRDAARTVRTGLDQLARARGAVTRDPDVLSGAPVFQGTRIAVHDIADMLANGDNLDAVLEAYPQLDTDQVRLGALYASAYPRRGRRRTKTPWRAMTPKSSETLVLDAIA